MFEQLIKATLLQSQTLQFKCYIWISKLLHRTRYEPENYPRKLFCLSFAGSDKATALFFEILYGAQVNRAFCQSVWTRSINTTPFVTDPGSTAVPSTLSKNCYSRRGWSHILLITPDCNFQENCQQNYFSFEASTCSSTLYFWYALIDH